MGELYCCKRLIVYRPAMACHCNCSGAPTGREGVVIIFKLSCTLEAMLLLVKCFDIKMVKLPGSSYVGTPHAADQQKKKKKKS